MMKNGGKVGMCGKVLTWQGDTKEGLGLPYNNTLMRTSPFQQKNSVSQERC